MAVRYKQKCCRCRKNYVSVTWRTKFPVCYDCDKKRMVGEITDLNMKKLFDIPEELYKDSMFLRDIKINYLRYGKLSERQIEVFKEVVEKVKENIVKKEEKTKKMLEESELPTDVEQESEALPKTKKKRSRK